MGSTPCSVDGKSADPQLREESTGFYPERFAFLVYVAGELALCLKVLKYKKSDIFEADYECEAYIQAYQRQIVDPSKLDKVAKEIVKRVTRSEFLDLQSD